MSSKSRPEDAVAAAVDQVLRPLIRLLLRNGSSYSSFADLAKRIFVDIAMHELGIPGRKQTVSRASILTGLSRKEVLRVLREVAAPESKEATERYNRAARVIAGWVRDHEFADRDGEPAVLPLDGESKSFTSLVRRYSGDVPARAILDELVRVGAVRRDAEQRVHLQARVYIPQTSDADKLAILGSDVSDLITTIDHNLQHGADDPRLQRKVMYDNVPEEAVRKFRKLSEKESQALIERFDRWLSEHDRDTNPAVTGSGRMRTGIGIFYFEERIPPGGSEEDSQ